MGVNYKVLLTDFAVGDFIFGIYFSSYFSNTLATFFLFKPAQWCNNQRCKVFQFNLAQHGYPVDFFLHTVQVESYHTSGHDEN